MKRGVLLLNMGGPNRLEEVELFLQNMFADSHILPVNRFLRKFIGRYIVNKRLQEAIENYDRLGGSSPMTRITRSLCTKVENLVRISVRPAMRYVPPFADNALEEFKGMGIDELVLFPMYPHYSTTTTLSSYDDVLQRCDKMGYNPHIRLEGPYFDNNEYINIQCDLIMEAIGVRDPGEYLLILSAHGLPMSIVRSGDPYARQIEANAVSLKKTLEERGVIFKNIKLAYQSRIGSGKWLEPDLKSTLKESKMENILLFPLSLTIDNSETLYELEIEHREIAERYGCGDYLVASCPNDDDDFAVYIARQIVDH